MVDPSGTHVWTWDARPYPVFPSATEAWGDGAHWETGHWLTGRLGSSNMEGLMSAILSDSGAEAFDVSALGEGPDGYVIDRPMSARAAIEPLALAYAFDATEDGGLLVFRQRGGEPVLELDEGDCVLTEKGAPLRLMRAAGNRIAACSGARLFRCAGGLSTGGGGIAKADRCIVAAYAERPRDCHR